MKQKNINKRDGFTFFNSVYNATKKLNDKQLALFMRTFLDVQFLQKKWDDVSFDDDLLDMMWTNMVNTVESQIAGYLVNKNSNNHQFIGVYDENTPPSYPPYDTPPKEVQVQVQSKVQSEKEYSSEFLELWKYYQTEIKGDKRKAFNSYIGNKLNKLDIGTIKRVLDFEMNKKFGQRHLVTIFNSFSSSLEVIEDIEIQDTKSSYYEHY